MKYLSTFSGIGGFELGIQQAYENRNTNVSEVGGRQKIEARELQEIGKGLYSVPSEATLHIGNGDNELPYWSINERQPHCIGYSEIDKHATQIYQKQFPYEQCKNCRMAREQECSSSAQGRQEAFDLRGTRLPQDNGDINNINISSPTKNNCECRHKPYGDITKIVAEKLPDFDLLVGGFPCQAFSIAGKRGGFEDTRGTMFFELARIAKAKVPMFLLLENVKGLVSHNGGQTLEVILETLQELGYYTNYEIHNSKDHGVPQNRERIFFLCKHIKGLTSVGQSQKMTTYDKIIQEYLFQLLLNNLAEVKKLQGLASKDLILGYLLLREIKEKLPNPDISESILGGISTLTVENISQLKAEEVWQNIDMCLKNIWVYDSNELSKYTTSTAIKQIIDSKTYTYSRMFQAISLATVHLRDLQKNLWNEMLSGLTVIQENTKYARINNENEETIITESGTAHRKSELQDVQRYFALGHLRGTTRPEVFPFGHNSQAATELSGQHSNTLTTRYYAGQANGTYITESKLDAQIRQHIKHTRPNEGEIGVTYKENGDIRPHRLDVKKSGISELAINYERNVSNTITSSHEPKIYREDMRIRRLTPTECERLQGFPDNWTEGISDSQRYKCLGNAVTVNVIRKIFEQLLNMEENTTF